MHAIRTTRARALAPIRALDDIRALLLSLFGRPLAPLFADRSRRVATIGVASVLVAFALTLVAPGALLAWGPLLLGAPHLVADVRYLIVRPGLHVRPAVVCAVVAPALAAWVFPTAAMAGVAVFGAAVASRGGPGRRLVAGSLGVAIGLVAWRFDRAADLVLAHAHNVVALVLWVVLFRRKHTSARAHVAALGPSLPRKSPRKLPPLAAASWVIGVFAAGVLAFVSGAADRIAFDALLASTAIDVNRLVPSLAPVADPVWAVRLTLLFAFAQSVHYAVWLRLVPEDDREREAPRPFVRSVEALVAELSAKWVVFAVTIAALLLVWGLVDAARARDGYLRLALFHGPLELGIFALFCVERRTQGAVR